MSVGRKTLCDNSRTVPCRGTVPCRSGAVVLIGMPGAGKSTLGVLLAKALGMEFVDTDIIIQNNEGKLLQEIIDEHGIDAFIKIEEEVVKGLYLMNCVIATGGSVVYSEDSMGFLKQNSQIIYLKLSYDEIEKRLKNITTRGVVIRKDQSLKDLYEERVPLYNKFCDKTIDCSNKDVEQCIEEIIENL